MINNKVIIYNKSLVILVGATDKTFENGPFDIIGDVHGCFNELVQLLKKLGYKIDDENRVSHLEGRKIIFVGDLVDRGPKSLEVLQLVMQGVESGVVLCVKGNHDDKLRRKLIGRNVIIANGLQETLDQLEHTLLREDISEFLNKLPSHYLLDNGRLAVAHAGLKEKYFGRDSPSIQRFCMYGATNGKFDEYGFPIRERWEHDYHGEALIVYGHTPIKDPRWINNTINIDTGCVFGGRLTALRYPEEELVSVEALNVYWNSIHSLYN